MMSAEPNSSTISSKERVTPTACGLYWIQWSLRYISETTTHEKSNSLIHPGEKSDTMGARAGGRARSESLDPRCTAGRSCQHALSWANYFRRGGGSGTAASEEEEEEEEEEGEEVCQPSPGF
eukprot:8086965-Pyramimonas_sp.AAC.1